jgi:wyosine [tRNA(Phe)-imidazoG37] synthetase (radical SAM superfamily)
MGTFTFQDIYDEDGRKILELDILHDNHCNFDCVFCPIGGTAIKRNDPLSIKGTEDSFLELKSILKESNVDVVYFNSNGESFINDKFEEIVDYIRGQGIKVRLFSNGYMLGMPEYIEIANKCDEVFGEVKCSSESSFLKYQRPVEGYSLKEYIDNMVNFKKQFGGKFTLIVTILKGHNDDEQSITWLKETIQRISPDDLSIETLTDDKYGKAFGVSEEKLQHINEILMH